MQEDERQIGCIEFEELLSDYLEGNLGKAEHAGCSTHVLACALCHELLNEVKTTLEACHLMAGPGSQLSLLEARILEKTTPDRLMGCEEFEEHLTEYLDGFLEASVFHRWERHSVACEACTDLPGAVVRSIAACYTTKTEELEVPAALTARILRATVGTSATGELKASRSSLLEQWIRDFAVPIQVSQFASVATVLLFALVFLVNEVSADGSVREVYEKGFALASQTYREGAEMMTGEATPIEDGGIDQR